MKRLIFFLILIFSYQLFAQNAGVSGLSFLKIGSGASEVSQAEATTGNFNSPFSLNYNPAFASELNYSSIGLMHNEWIQDLRSEFLIANTVVYGFPIFVTINSTKISDIEIRTQPGEPAGMFDANYFAAGIGTGVKIFNDVSTGIQFKYLYENIYVDEADGYAFDLGIFKKNLFMNLNAGFSLRNIGKMNQLASESTTLPSEIRFGISNGEALNLYNFKFHFSGDVQKFFKEDQINLLIGLDVKYNDLISLRTGYNSGKEINHFSFGLGLNYKSIYFDYAFLPFTQNFGNANLISIYIKL